MPFINCHVFKNPFATSFLLAQVATDETMASEYYKKMPISKVFVPMNGLHEITDFYDDVFCASGFVKSGLLTESQAENEPSTYGDTLPLRFIEEGKATCFYVEPYPRDRAGYSNLSRLYLLPASFIKHVKPIITEV